MESINHTPNKILENLLDNISSREKLIEIFQPSGNGIEVGVYKGEFSNAILKTCPDLNLYLLDCWQAQDPSLYHDILNASDAEMAENLISTINNNKNYFNRLKIIKDFSDNAVKFFEDNFFDFIYIDANHSYEMAKKDISLWYPKLKKGGLFAGHDYLNKVLHMKTINKLNYEQTEAYTYQVKLAVDEFAEEKKIKVYSTNEEHLFKTWFILK